MSTSEQFIEVITNIAIHPLFPLYWLPNVWNRWFWGTRCSLRFNIYIC